MKIIPAGYSILKPDLDDPEIAEKIYRMIELAGRTCYKSANKVTDESAERFVRNLIKNGHEAMLEHVSLSVLFTVDRGVSHELVRHRLASFAQESTRYCNYSQDKFGNELAYIEPIFFKDVPEERRKEIRIKGIGAFENGEENADPKERQYCDWYCVCKITEDAYLHMLNLGATPQEARSVLPNSLKTEVVMTANLREWRHILKLRAAGMTGKPHPQMLEVMVPLLNELRLKLPALFDDIQPMEEET